MNKKKKKPRSFDKIQWKKMEKEEDGYPNPRPLIREVKIVERGDKLVVQFYNSEKQESETAEIPANLATAIRGFIGTKERQKRDKLQEAYDTLMDGLPVPMRMRMMPFPFSPLGF